MTIENLIEAKKEGEGFIQMATNDLQYLENAIKKDLKKMEIVTITYYEKTDLEIILNFQEYFINELEITPNLDREGFGSIKIDSYKAFFYNGDADQEEIKFSPEAIAALENELKDFYDWDEYKNDQEPDPDRYRD